MRWEGHVTSTQEVRSAYNMMIRNLKGRSYWEDLTADRRIILKCTLQSQECHGVNQA
jgi:hypothetical protein